MSATRTPVVTSSDSSDRSGGRDPEPETEVRDDEQESSRPPGAHGKDGEGDSDGRSGPYEEEPESSA